jgi:hypothetical protein
MASESATYRTTLCSRRMPLPTRSSRALPNGFPPANALARPAPRRLDGEQRVSGLRLSVGDEGVIQPEVEVHVVEDDKGEEVAAGTHGHDLGAAAGGERVVQSDGQGEVPQPAFPASSGKDEAGKW